MTPLEPAERAVAVAAAAANHESWNAAQAAASGGSLVALGGGIVAYIPGREAGDVQVLFAEPDPQRPGAVADDLLAHVGTLPPVRGIGWWATDSELDWTLGASLLGRGFAWGWQPHWMRLDVTASVCDAPEIPNVTVREIAQDVQWDVADLPNYEPDRGGRFGALTHMDPPSTWVFAAFMGDDVVGHVTLHVTQHAELARRGIATTVGGLHNMGVVPAARRRGIGRALTAHAIARAAQVGCRMLVLNATPLGEPVYRGAGFESAGWGQTWWMTGHHVGAPPPPPSLVRLVEAIGAADLDELDHATAVARSRRELDLNAALPCGLTPLGVAVTLRQPTAARRLVTQGARLDVISAWDLGWKHAAAELLRDNPALANERTGDLGATPLQIAIDRDDEELARLVLSVDPDLTIKDRTFQATALGWAVHLERPHLADLIRASGDRRLL